MPSARAIRAISSDIAKFFEPSSIPGKRWQCKSINLCPQLTAAIPRRYFEVHIQCRLQWAICSESRCALNFCTCVYRQPDSIPNPTNNGRPCEKVEFALVSFHSPRLIFINRYFHPDQSATSRLLSDLAFSLADAGHEILILTSQQRYDNADARLPAREIRGRVKVHRLAATRFGRMRLLGRAVDYVSFYVSMAVDLLKLARAGDTIIPMTDPP